MKFTQEMYDSIISVELYACHQCDEGMDAVDLHWIEYASDEYQVEGHGYTCENCIRDQEFENMETFRRGPSLDRVLVERSLTGGLATE